MLQGHMYNTTVKHLNCTAGDYRPRITTASQTIRPNPKGEPISGLRVAKATHVLKFFNYFLYKNITQFVTLSFRALIFLLPSIFFNFPSLPFHINCKYIKLMKIDFIK